MPVLKTEFSCPKCKRETGKLIQLLAAEGRITCPEVSGHRWVDTAAFFDDHPTMDFKPELVKAQQTDIAPLKITLKNKVLSAAKKKWGDKLEATVAQIVEQLTEGEVMTIGETDLNRMKERLGTRPANSGELIGLIYAKMCEVDEAKEDRDRAVKDLKAYEGMSPGRIVVDLGKNLPTAAAKAEDESMPLKLWVESKLATALENGWF